MCGMARKASKYMSNNKGVGEGKGLRKCMAGVGCNGGTKKKKKTENDRRRNQRGNIRQTCMSRSEYMTEEGGHL